MSGAWAPHGLDQSGEAYAGAFADPVDAVDHEGSAEDDASEAGPWVAFGDVMTGLLGAFVLLLVFVIGVQLELGAQLQAALEQKQAAEARRSVLETALQGPLASGRVTFQAGRIGISGSVLFDLNSDRLQPEGRALLQSLAASLKPYLAVSDDWLMVSGFTDDRQIRSGNRRFDDNLELSAQRAMTVTRTLVEAGVPADRLFSAAFGAQQPVASNEDAQGRALNRRVEIAPMPRSAPRSSP